LPLAHPHKAAPHKRRVTVGYGRLSPYAGTTSPLRGYWDRYRFRKRRVAPYAAMTSPLRGYWDRFHFQKRRVAFGLCPHSTLRWHNQPRWGYWDQRALDNGAIGAQKELGTMRRRYSVGYCDPQTLKGSVLSARGGMRN